MFEYFSDTPNVLASKFKLDLKKDTLIHKHDNSVTVNSAEYVTMPRVFFFFFFEPQSQHFKAYNNRTWKQQNGATCHTFSRSIPLMKEVYPDKLISRRVDISWHPRSPDLTPADFFLWGYVTRRVYVNTPRTTTESNDNFQQKIANIPRSMSTSICKYKG